MYIHVKVKNTSVYKILQRKAATLERGCFHEYKCIYIHIKSEKYKCI